MTDSENNLTQLSDLLKTIAEPNRLKIIRLLMQGVQCNCEIGSNLQMAPNLISHHLSVLKKAGLVAFTRHPTDARWIYYSINRNNMDWLQEQMNIFFNTPHSSEIKTCCGPAEKPLKREHL